MLGSGICFLYLYANSRRLHHSASVASKISHGCQRKTKTDVRCKMHRMDGTGNAESAPLLKSQAIYGSTGLSVPK